MKAALISDIHGNCEALNCVLDDAQARGVGMYVFLGDYVFDFPDSPQVVETLMSLPNAHFIAGNKEGYLRANFWNDARKAGLEQFAVLFETRRQLSAAQREFLCALPDSRTVLLPSGRRLYCVHSGRSIAHYPRTPFSNSGAFADMLKQENFDRAAYLRGTEEFSRQYLGAALRDMPADAVAYGHDHLQAWARVEGKLIVRPGSVGLPLDGDRRAAYALIDDSADALRVEARRVDYDVDAFLARARQSACYRAGWRWSELVYNELARGSEIVAGFFEDARAIAREKGEDPADFGNETFRAAFERTRRREGI